MDSLISQLTVGRGWILINVLNKIDRMGAIEYWAFYLSGFFLYRLDLDSLLLLVESVYQKAILLPICFF